MSSSPVTSRAVGTRASRAIFAPTSRRAQWASHAFPARPRLGHPPRKAKRLVVDPDEAETVRMIFELVERGGTASSIARELNDKGLARRSGKPWTQRQVAAILERQVLYREGVIRYGEATGQNAQLGLLA